MKRWDPDPEHWSQEPDWGPGEDPDFEFPDRPEPYEYEEPRPPVRGGGNTAEGEAAKPQQ